MRIIRENVNLAALVLYIFIIVPFDSIFFGGFISRKIEAPYSSIIIIVSLILEIILLGYYAYKRIYYIKLDEGGIIIRYKLRNIEKEYTIEMINEVVILYSQSDSMYNINFYFEDNLKSYIPSSDKEELKKVYRFFKDKGVECKVVGLPAGRIPEDYDW